MLQALAAPAQALFLRLFQRSGPWFRQRALDYSEVADVGLAVDQLAAVGMAEPMDAAQASQLACAAEVRPRNWTITERSAAGTVPRPGGASLLSWNC